MPTPEPSDLAGWSPSLFREWVAGLEESQAPRDINWWLQVRWTPQLHAYDAALADEARREWAEVFLLLVDCMERFTTYDRWYAASDRFGMRALLIRKLGQVDGSAQWSANALMHDVLAMLPVSSMQAREQAGQWRSLPKDQILTLRRYKGVLGPLASVADLLASSQEATVAQEWLTLRPDLP